MKVGDYVKRNTWWEKKTESNSGFGLILELHRRTLEHYTAEEIEAKPIRTITVLQKDGEIKKWYTVHTEVISECR